MTKLYALIIEDDPKLGVIFQKALEKAGFEAEIEQGGRDFARRFAGRAPVLIILDIHLPYASGMDILEQIRSRDGWDQAVVIVATADLFLAKSLAGKADHPLIKPVSVARVMKIVEQYWPENTLRVPAPESDKDHG